MAGLGHIRYRGTSPIRKRPPAQDPPRIGLRGLVLVTVGVTGSGLGFEVFDCRMWSHAVQGYLAHKKTPTPSGPP